MSTPTNEGRRQPVPASLDPVDWSGLRAQGHRMLDDMLDYLQGIRERPVWQPIPDAVRGRFREPLPRQGSGLDQVHQTFMDSILPFAVGNAHPGFMGWVHGGGRPSGCWRKCSRRGSMPIWVAATISRSRWSGRCCAV
ncbi:hypothetical protein ACU4GI_03780 [Cupriavidus basilensis]